MTAGPAAGLTIGIDASNLRRGGGPTHLFGLLNAAQPNEHGVTRLIVWAGSETIKQLPVRGWLEARTHPWLDKSALHRALWQRYVLPSAVRREQCDLLFAPGGFGPSVRPLVTMSRNLLPFEWHELRRYGWSRIGLRLLWLRRSQRRTFRRADGVIFLTPYAQERVEAVTGSLGGLTAIIAHGLDAIFLERPRRQRAISEYSETRPFRLLYVSIIDLYKHQWHVVEAVDQLRKTTGWPVTLDLVGPAYPPALARLRAAIARVGTRGDATWVRYHGEMPHRELHEAYRRADCAVFASSCENMPNILLEAMAAGLPIACSKRGPMPEVLSTAGAAFFDPEDSSDMSRALRALVGSADLRTAVSAVSFQRAQEFSWRRCADETLAFLRTVHLRAAGS